MATLEVRRNWEQKGQPAITRLRGPDNDDVAEDVTYAATQWLTRRLLQYSKMRQECSVSCNYRLVLETVAPAILLDYKAKHILQEEKPEKTQKSGCEWRDDPSRNNLPQDRPADSRGTLQNRDSNNRSDNRLRT